MATCSGADFVEVAVVLLGEVHDRDEFRHRSQAASKPGGTADPSDVVPGEWDCSSLDCRLARQTGEY